MKQNTGKFLDIRKKDSFTIEVSSYTTDMLGNITANVPGTKYPFYLFGKMDADGGYTQGSRFVPSLSLPMLYTGIMGKSFDYFLFQNFPVLSNFVIGDIIHVFGNVNNLNSLVFVCQHIQYNSVAAIVQNKNQGKIEIYELLYSSDNLQNYAESLQFVKLDMIGLAKSDIYNPLSFKTIDTVLADFIRLNIKFDLSENLGIYSYIYAATTKLKFNFKILY